MLSDGIKHSGIIRFFEEISAIPRGSYNEKAIADHLVDFANKRGLDVYRDELNNVLINMPATVGYENTAPILLEAHTDMVCEKNNDVEHDFLTDGLELYEEDGWIRARGTTLGADDGIGVATMLYVLDGGITEHPAIQCFFTSMEEVGMDGAKGFDYSRIFARTMFSLDGNSPDEIVVGGSGGIRTNVRMSSLWEEYDAEAVRISIKGLCGGHSGEDVHKGRANANKLMGYVLLELSEKLSGDIRLVSLSGGSKDNAIPREAEAVVVCNDERLIDYVKEIETNIMETLSEEDKDFRIVTSKKEKKIYRCLDAKSTENIICFISVITNGIIEMDKNISGVVEYSRNLGTMRTDEKGVEFVISTRSGFEHRVDGSVRELDALAKALGGVCEHHSKYPGWKYSKVSPLRDRYCKAYEKRYGKPPVVMVIHAGLECGVFTYHLPDLDIVSCGSVVVDLHSPDERLNKESIDRFFEVFADVIREK